MQLIKKLKEKNIFDNVLHPNKCCKKKEISLFLKFSIIKAEDFINIKFLSIESSMKLNEKVKIKIRILKPKS